MASIIAIAAASVVHPASSLKLAGTALTLVGGVASWFSEHPLELARPLEAVLSALASPDEKLARNAATALNRLCIHSGCAALLLGCYAGCVSGLQRLLPGPEVTLRHKPGKYHDGLSWLRGAAPSVLLESVLMIVVVEVSSCCYEADALQHIGRR